MKEIPNSQSIRSRLKVSQSSPLRAYKNLTVGESTSTIYLILYEFLTFLLGPLPGGLGFYLRKKLYPLLFKKVGQGLIIGRNVVLRHPANIILGDNVTIDDNCLIDARGAGNEGVILEDQVIINRNCVIQAKAGPIRLGRRTSIGSNSVIISMDGVEVGEAVLFAGGCCISAGSYHFDETSEPIMDQGCFTKGPIRVGSNSWLGTNVTILDGVTIGTGSVIGAGAIVNKNIADYAIAVGIPARVIKNRRISVPSS